MQATITSKGQITLPKAIRDQLDLAAGDRVEFIVEADNVVRMVPRTTSIKRLKGMLPQPEHPGKTGTDHVFHVLQNRGHAEKSGLSPFSAASTWPRQIGLCDGGRGV
ncbi:MAG TPA: hypothetical protein DDY14_17885 [Chromatiaceae bacterium]|nr:hypothetical protein [Chromatiaceae bacterium]